MAHKLYFDNVNTRGATLNDGTVTEDNESGAFSFADSTSLTDEDKAIDLSLDTAITSWSTATREGDALQFNLGSAKSVNFASIYYTAADTDALRIHYDDAASGVTNELSDFTQDYAVGWNILNFPATYSAQYWIVEAAAGSAVGISEIYFGTALALPIDGNSITTRVPFSSFKSSTYNNTEFTNKIDTELREWTIRLPIITEANKTSLELLQTNYSNLYTFVYYDESAYHTVRLAKPFAFNQIATNTYSTTITLKESP